jgi:hypothetical protein
MRTAVIGPDGRIAVIYDGADWSATGLVEDLRESLLTLSQSRSNPRNGFLIGSFRA